jgi:hypothetical protein
MSDPDRHLRDAFREALKLTEWTDDKEQEATFERTREHIRKYLRTPEGDGEATCSMRKRRQGKRLTHEAHTSPVKVHCLPTILAFASVRKAIPRRDGRALPFEAKRLFSPSPAPAATLSRLDRGFSAMRTWP